MGFDLKINGETVYTVDADPRLIAAFNLGAYRVPITTDQTDLEITVEMKSVTDAEVVQALRSSSFEEYAKENEALSLVPDAEKEARQEFANTMVAQETKDQQAAEREENESGSGVGVDSSDGGSSFNSSPSDRESGGGSGTDNPYELGEVKYEGENPSENDPSVISAEAEDYTNVQTQPTDNTQE